MPYDERVGTALVVGGSGGIGSAITARLVADGRRVVVADRRPPTVDGALFVEVDLADDANTRAAVAAASGLLGSIDLLVNSAGIFQLKPLLEIDADDFDRMLTINARSVLATMQAAAPEMIARGAGCIVNLASMAAKQGGANEGHYAASKAAVVALTRAAALEWGAHGVRVNAVCPGYVLTEMGAATRTDDDVARWTAQSPLGRLGDPNDVAGVVAFLASPDGSYLTGQALNVTGGMVMH
jgi:NAD(P)-dependent dehydrogenase (short-subunit alcohol dehydrogenase family)